LTILAGALALVAAGTAQSEKASQLLSEMMVRYYNAPYVSGTVEMTQDLDPFQLRIEMDFALDRADRQLYIRQESFAPDQPGRVTHLVTDGTTVYYHVPKVEREVQDNKEDPVALEAFEEWDDLGWAYGAGRVGLIDPDVIPFDVAIADREDLDFMRRQWVTVEYGGLVDLNGEQVHLVQGDYRMATGTEVIGRYAFYITDDHELKRYVEKINFAAPDQNVIRTRILTTTYDVDFEIGKEEPDEKFEVPPGR
jgi:hypothetical protein